MSLCGREVNFLCPYDDYCVVFTEMEDADDSNTASTASTTSTTYLFYADKTLRQTFRPDMLRMSESGRLYHPTSDHGRLHSDMGLLHPHLTQSLDLQIEADETFSVQFKGQWYPIRTVEPAIPV